VLRIDLAGSEENGPSRVPAGPIALEGTMADPVTFDQADQRRHIDLRLVDGQELAEADDDLVELLGER
jgi:hypothetical protein